MVMLFIGIVVLLLGICFLCGYFIKYILKIGFQCNTCTTGFVAVLGIFQIVALPHMYWHLGFTSLYITFIIFLWGMMSAGIICYMATRGQRLHRVEAFLNILSRKTFILAMMLIIVQCAVYIIMISKGTDDSFYLAIINTIIESDEVLSYDPTTGNSLFQYMPQYELIGYEVLGAIICRLFHLNGAQYCHVILPVFCLVIHYFVVYDICKVISIHSNVENKADILFCLFSVFNLFSKYTGGVSRGSRLLGSLWHGKAMLINIILPFLIVVFLEIMSIRRVEKNILVLLFFAFYSAFSATATGVYLFPISYAVYTLVFSCMMRSLKEPIKLCIPVILAMPYVILKYVALAKTETISRLTEDAEALSYIDALKEFNGTKYMIVVYGAALLILLLFAEKKQQYLFAIYPIFGFLTFLNPFLQTYIAKHITGTDVYDRLFWLLQITFTFMAAIACIMYRLREKRWITAGIILLGMLLSGCELRYYNARFELKENLEGITNTTKHLADFIIMRGDGSNRLMLPPPYVYEVRQYTGKIELVWSLYVSYVLPENVNEDYAERLDKLYNVLYQGGDINSDVWDDFRYFDVKYVGVSADDARDFGECPIVFKDTNLKIYDVKKR